MKRLTIIIAMLLITAIAANAQSVINQQSKRSKYSSMRLITQMKDGVTVYAWDFTPDLKKRNKPLSGKLYYDPIVPLGDKEQAIRIMTFLLDYNSKKGDIINLENGYGHYATGGRGWLKIYSIYTEDGYNVGMMAKKQLKEFIKFLSETGK